MKILTIKEAEYLLQKLLPRHYVKLTQKQNESDEQPTILVFIDDNYSVFFDGMKMTNESVIEYATKFSVRNIKQNIYTFIQSYKEAQQNWEDKKIQFYKLKNVIHNEFLSNGIYETYRKSDGDCLTKYYSIDTLKEMTFPQKRHEFARYDFDLELTHEDVTITVTNIFDDTIMYRHTVNLDELKLNYRGE